MGYVGPVDVHVTVHELSSDKRLDVRDLVRRQYDYFRGRGWVRLNIGPSVFHSTSFLKADKKGNIFTILPWNRPQFAELNGNPRKVRIARFSIGNFKTGFYTLGLDDGFDFIADAFQYPDHGGLTGRRPLSRSEVLSFRDVFRGQMGDYRKYGSLSGTVAIQILSLRHPYLVAAAAGANLAYRMYRKTSVLENLDLYYRHAVANWQDRMRTHLYSAGDM